MRTGDGVWLHGFFYSLQQTLVHMDKIPLSFLFSSTNNSRSLIPASEMFLPLHNLQSFNELASVCPCLSCSGKLRTGCCFTAAEQRGIITPIRVLATLFLVNHSMLLVFLAAMAHRCSLGTLHPPELQGISLPSYFSAGQPQNYTGTWGYSSPGAGPGISLYWTSQCSWCSISPASWDPSEQQAHPSALSVSPVIYKFAWGWSLSHRLAHSWTC